MLLNLLKGIYVESGATAAPQEEEEEEEVRLSNFQPSLYTNDGQ